MQRLLIVMVLLITPLAAQNAKAPIKTNLSANAPRYQIIVNPESRRDIFLLDSFTGRIWRMRLAVDDVYYWKAEERVDNAQEEAAWYETHLTKEQLKKLANDAK